MLVLRSTLNRTVLPTSRRCRSRSSLKCIDLHSCTLHWHTNKLPPPWQEKACVRNGHRKDKAIPIAIGGVTRRHMSHLLPCWLQTNCMRLGLCIPIQFVANPILVLICETSTVTIVCVFRIAAIGRQCGQFIFARVHELMLVENHDGRSIWCAVIQVEAHVDLSFRDQLGNQHAPISVLVEGSKNQRPPASESSSSEAPDPKGSSASSRPIPLMASDPSSDPKVSQLSPSRVSEVADWDSKSCPSVVC